MASSIDYSTYPRLKTMIFDKLLPTNEEFAYLASYFEIPRYRTMTLEKFQSLDPIRALLAVERIANDEVVDLLMYIYDNKKPLVQKSTFGYSGGPSNRSYSDSVARNLQYPEISSLSNSLVFDSGDAVDKKVVLDAEFERILNQFTTSVTNTGTVGEIFVNNVPINCTDLLNELAAAKELECREVLQQTLCKATLDTAFISVNENSYELRHHSIIHDVEKLQRSSETDYQKWFNDNNLGAFLQTAYADCRQRPFPQPLKNGYYRFTSRIDNYSTLRCLNLEIKSSVTSSDKGTVSDTDDASIPSKNYLKDINKVDKYTILQSLKSTLAFGSVNDIQRTMGTVAMTDHLVVLVWLSREWREVGIRKLYNKLNFIRMKPTELSKVWGYLAMEAIQYPDSLFLDAEDARLLTPLLNYLCKAPCYCRVKIIGASSCRVYKISLPRWIQEDGSSFFAVGRDAVLSVKVALNHAEYVKERDVLIKIRDWLVMELNRLQNTDRYTKALENLLQFYSIGYMNRGEEPVFTPQWYQHVKRMMDLSNEDIRLHSKTKYPVRLDQLDPEDQVPWYFNAPQLASKYGGGGLLLLRTGEYHNSEAMLREDIFQAWPDLQSSLRHIHDAGVIQCDLRRANLMYFPQQVILQETNTEIVIQGNWQVIDMSLAAVVGLPPDRLLAGIESLTLSGHELVSPPPILTREGARLRIHVESGQWNGAPDSISSAPWPKDGDEFIVWWTQLDDVAMLNKVVYRYASKRDIRA